MAEEKDRIEGVRGWVAEHKLRTVGCLWLSGIAGSIAYNWSRPTMKTSVKIIHARQEKCSFDAIYQLGDSTSDTGNYIMESPVGNISECAVFPYGTTYFTQPTGRCSDGLLIIDYLAMAVGLQFIDPWMNKRSSFENGVNFAVSGATALPVEALAKLNVPSPYTNSSLNVQIDWMREFFRGSKKVNVERSIIFVGPIGGNDYDFALFTNKTNTQVNAMVADVVASIGAAVEGVIEMGAKSVVVPGGFPVGCFPYHLSRLSSKLNADAYDQFGCVKWLNQISEYHNEMLNREIGKLQQTHTNITIVYSDYYDAFLGLLNADGNEGFGEDHRLKACCGEGGEHNFSMEKMCGSGGEVNACSDRMKWVNWDGIHLTQAAHEFLTRHILSALSQHFSCLTFYNL